MPHTRVRKPIGLRHVRRAAFRVFGTVTPEYAANWFEPFLLTPARYPTTRPIPPLTHGDRGQILSANGLLTTWSWGSGPTVLLMHGWGGHAGHLEALVDPLVRGGYRVVAYDAPAHGRSHGTQTNLIECGHAALAVAEHVGSVHGVIGHSFGGASAAVATKFGLRPQRLVLIGTPSSIARLSTRVATGLGFPIKVADRMQQRVAERLGMDWREMQTDTILSQATFPVLVIHDRDDREVPWDHAAAIARAAPAGVLHTTTDLGHRGIVGDPAVIDRVVNFLA